MNTTFRKTRLAAAVSAAMAMGLAAPAGAVVVVGGDNGWEVSFDGNINLFYNVIDTETTVSGVTPTGQDDSMSKLNEGLLPAFFSFNAKSPTVNGLTGTARVSFAPDSSSSKTFFNDKAGTIDMREVFANIDGSFGTISFGRTLGIFARQAILKDQTLFGVGDPIGRATEGGGGTTLGRIGMGYIYPEFRTRFAYKTPDINGFKVEVGIFDPMEAIAGPAGAWQTETPRFEGEATYGTTFSGGTFNIWVSGLWQDMDQTLSGGDTVTHEGVDVGAEVGFGGFDFVGYYYTGSALGVDVKWGADVTGFGGAGSSAIAGAPGYSCFGNVCNEADNDGFYVQGAYTFAGKTKLALSYGETNQDSDTDAINPFNDIQHQMWTVGVYHDVTSWLKLIGEYNDGESTAEAAGSGAALNSRDFEAFSVGAFMFW